MTRRDVTEAEVQAKLDVLRAGQPWSGLGAAATVVAVMVLLGKTWLEQQGAPENLVYGAALVLFAAGIALQIMGRRKRKLFLQRQGQAG